MAYGKPMELFIVNGTADSLIPAKLSNWNGKAIRIFEVTFYKYDNITQVSIYFLF